MLNFKIRFQNKWFSKWTCFRGTFRIETGDNQ